MTGHPDPYDLRAEPLWARHPLTYIFAFMVAPWALVYLVASLLGRLWGLLD